MSPIVSVIIPTYQRKKGIVRAVESALAQKMTAHFEVIVIDDGTEEGHLAKPVLQRYIDAGQIQYIQNTGPHGAAFARNLGVSQAKGKYITFLDDDDCYLPGRLNNMLSTIEANNYVFVSATRFHEYFDFQVIKPLQGQLSGLISLNDIQWINDIDIGILLKRQDFLDLNGYDTAFNNLEDWDFLLRLLQKGNGFKLERQDYAENVDPDRSRNSDKGHLGYRQIAEKHHAIFGDRWYGTMLAISDQGKGLLNLQKALGYSFRYKTISPFTMYLRQLLR